MALSVLMRRQGVAVAVNDVVQLSEEGGGFFVG